MRVRILVAACAASLALAAPAHAATGTYAGTLTNVSGNIAFDVKIKHGYVKRVIRMRGNALPAVCEISGPVSSIQYDLATSMLVNARSGRFGGSYTQPTYG